MAQSLRSRSSVAPQASSSSSSTTKSPTVATATTISVPTTTAPAPPPPPTPIAPSPATTATPTKATSTKATKETPQSEQKKRASPISYSYFQKLMRLRIEREDQFVRARQGNSDTVASLFQEITAITNEETQMQYSWEAVYKKWKSVEAIARVSVEFPTLNVMNSN
jgi:hypothetical protein